MIVTIGLDSKIQKIYLKGGVVDFTSASSGDVIGPGSATDNNVVFFDGTTGKLIKDSGLALSGNNTGDQTNITGNAGTADELSTARDINGVSFDGSADIVTESFLNIIADLGGGLKSVHPFGFVGNSGSGLADNRVFFQAVRLPKDATITGVNWIQVTQGNYTADQYNGVGLYTYSGGTLTLVRSSTNDGDIWKAASGSWGSKAFSATYDATAGLYFIAALYCQSAQTTAPSLHAVSSSSQSGMITQDFPNSGKLAAFLTGQTSFPTPQLMSGLTAESAPKFFGLY